MVVVAGCCVGIDVQRLMDEGTAVGFEKRWGDLVDVDLVAGVVAGVVDVEWGNIQLHSVVG